MKVSIRFQLGIFFFFIFSGRGLGSRAKPSLLQTVWIGQNKAAHWWRIETSRIYMYIILINRYSVTLGYKWREKGKGGLKLGIFETTDEH